MSVSDSGPESYSIDEMMERLRSRGQGAKDEEAQLVTRDDGSQAYKVRKRKRRSHQPKKEEEKRRKRVQLTQIGVAIGLLGVAGLSSVAGFLYLNSGAFRNGVLEQVAAASGAEVEMDEFRMTPITMGVGALRMRWPEGGVIRSFEAQGIGGTVAFPSLFFRPLRGDELRSSHDAKLVLGLPQGGGSAELGKKPLPLDFRYRANSMDVYVGDEKRPVFQVLKANATLTFQNEVGTLANLQMQSGRMILEGWSEWELKFLSMQLEKEGIALATAKLRPMGAEKGEVTVKNPNGQKLDPAAGSASYRLTMSGVTLADFGGRDFGRLLSATVESPSRDGEGSLEVKVGEKGGVVFRAPFQADLSQPVIASGLPCFEKLASDSSNPAYEKPRFDLEAKGVLERSASGMRLEELVLQARQNLELRGNLAVSATGELSGELDLGISEATLVELGGAYPRVFRRRDRGKCWALLTISGTLMGPRDNLTELLAVASSGVGPSGAGGVQGGNDEADLERAWEELTRPPGER